MKFGKGVINLLARRLVKGNKKRRENFNHYLNDYRCHLDVPFIDDNNPNHQIDIFYGKGNRKNICIIDIHGGAYIFGHHRDNFIYGKEFLDKGFDFISLDYVPNNGKISTKDLLDDIYQAMRFVFDHLKDYELENEKFVIAGDSAGGHFALLFFEASFDNSLSNQLGYQLDDINFVSCVLSCPVYDFANIYKGSLTKKASMRMFGPNFNNESLNQLISPKTHIQSVKGPIFLSTCNKDFLREQSLGLKDDGEKFHLDIEFIDLYTHAIGVEHVHNVVFPEYKESKYVNGKAIEFIELHCR